MTAVYLHIAIRGIQMFTLCYMKTKPCTLYVGNVFSWDQVFCLLYDSLLSQAGT